MTRTDEAARERLAAEMDRRRIALRLRWEEIAAMAGITTAHLRKFRRGDAGLGAIVEAKAEEALQWEPGSFRRLEAGLEPIPRDIASSSTLDTAETKAAVPPEPSPTPFRPQTVEELRAELGMLMAKLTPEERASLEEVIAEEEAELEALRLRRRLTWLRLMRGGRTDPNRDI